MIKDDHGSTKNPYKYMNVMKQDAMDDKIKERCKTCEKQCMQEDLNRSSRSQSRQIEQLLSICRADRKFLDGSRICREAIKTKSRKLDGLRL